MATNLAPDVEEFRGECCSADLVRMADTAVSRARERIEKGEGNFTDELLVFVDDQ